MIPKNYEWKTLGEVTSLCNYGYTAKAMEDSKGIVFLRITDINKDGTLKKEGFKYIPNKKEVIDKYKLQEGDIVIARSGSVGLSYLFDAKDGDMVFASYLIRFRIDKEKANPRYVNYILHSSLFSDFVNTKKRRVAQTNINATELKQFKLPIPSLDVQKEIVSVISKAEHLRRIRQEANGNPDIINKSLFFEMFGNPYLNSKGFNEKRLRDVSVISMGGTPSTKKQEYWKNGTVNWMKSGDIKMDFIKTIPQKITELGLKKSNAKVYKKGDVVIALNGQGKTRATTGILNIETTSNQSVASISPREELNSIYLHLNLKYRYQELRDLTGDKQRSGLNLTLLRNLKIMLPPFELQEKFASLVLQMQILKDKQQESTTEINKIYNSMIETIVCDNSLPY